MKDSHLQIPIHSVTFYQDDVLVHAPSKELHDSSLCRLLETTVQFNVAISPQKSVFSANQFSHLGYKISSAGISPDLKRLVLPG